MSSSAYSKVIQTVLNTIFAEAACNFVSLGL